MRDEIKRKWEKMMKGNEKWFRCECENRSYRYSTSYSRHVLPPVLFTTVVSKRFCPDCNKMLRIGRPKRR